VPKRAAGCVFPETAARGAWRPTCWSSSGVSCSGRRRPPRGRPRAPQPRPAATLRPQNANPYIILADGPFCCNSCIDTRTWPAGAGCRADCDIETCGRRASARPSEDPAWILRVARRDGTRVRDAPTRYSAQPRRVVRTITFVRNRLSSNLHNAATVPTGSSPATPQALPGISCLLPLLQLCGAQSGPEALCQPRRRRVPLTTVETQPRGIPG
jgi:hypothetical protein